MKAGAKMGRRTHPELPPDQKLAKVPGDDEFVPLPE